MAVAADRNPHLDWYAEKSSDFVWDNNVKNIDGIRGYQLGNAAAHQREGQNVLFMDIHVDFEKESFCGVDEDNIYTAWDTAVKKQQGRPPQCLEYDMSRPSGKTDSLLVNECGPSPDPTLTVITPPPPPPILSP